MSNYVSTKEQLVEPIKSLLTEADKRRLQALANKPVISEAAFIRLAVLRAMKLVEQEGYAALFRE